MKILAFALLFLTTIAFASDITCTLVSGNVSSTVSAEFSLEADVFMGLQDDSGVKDLSYYGEIECYDGTCFFGLTLDSMILEDEFDHVDYEFATAESTLVMRESFRGADGQKYQLSCTYTK